MLSNVISLLLQVVASCSGRRLLRRFGDVPWEYTVEYTAFSRGSGDCLFVTGFD